MARSRSKRQKASEPSGKKHHWKHGGFDAFNTQHIISHVSGRKKKKRKVSWVQCEEAVIPETGIHSLGWAQTITPQSSGFLKLPYEVRLKIYGLVISEFRSGIIEPLKRGNKFYSPNWPTAAKDTTRLYQICRQIYVDVVGGGLIYHFKRFLFEGPVRMLNYLWVIHPVHKDAIRAIELQLHFRPNNKCLPVKALTFLADCKGLQDLRLAIKIDQEVCSYSIIRLQYPAICEWKVPEDLLARMMESQELRLIKGLKRFDTKIEVHQWRRSDLFGWNTQYRVQAQSQARLHEVEENLRGVVLGTP